MKTNILTSSHISVPVTALLFTLLVYSSLYAAPMDKYIKKYNGVEISDPSVAKLAQYNDYIYYFTNFSFFKPRHKVSPDFSKALILAESSTNPRALSNKNARGLTLPPSKTDRALPLRTELPNENFLSEHTP